MDVLVEKMIYSGIGLLVSIIGITLAIAKFWYYRKSKMKIEIAIGKTVYGSYSLSFLLVDIINLSTFKKYAQKTEFALYNRFHIKVKTKTIAINIPLLMDNNSYEREENKKFYLDIGYLASMYFLDKVNDKYFTKINLIDSKGNRYLSNKITLSQISEVLSEKTEVPDEVKREFFEQMNWSLI